MLGLHFGVQFYSPVQMFLAAKGPQVADRQTAFECASIVNVVGDKLLR